MASALSVLKRTAPGVLFESATEFGAGVAIGELYGRHKDKWYGSKAPVLAAVLGKLGAVGMLAATGGRVDGVAGVGHGVLNGIGSAGLASIGLDLGLHHAMKAKGFKIARVSGALPAGAVELGALPPASPGRTLSWDDLETLTAMH